MRYLLHDVFLNTCIQQPDNLAIVHENKSNITYRELNKLSNRFSNLIKQIKTNIRQQPYVGILSSVNINSIACILGSLKLGCAYIPLDEYSPTNRLIHIINNTKLDVIAVDPLLYKQHHALFLDTNIKNIIFLDQFNESSNAHIQNKIIYFEKIQEESTTEPPIINQVSDDLAYILHSSGSTGIPKGIMLSHRNARTFVDWMQNEFKLNSDDIVMSRAPFKFDLSIFDIFNSFIAGATLVCFDWNAKRSEDMKHESYVQLMEKVQATILYTTPSTFVSLMNRGNLAKYKLNLRTIMYAGEPFPVPQLRKLKNILPDTKIANIYGPTETNIITYYWIKELPEDDTPIPLGHVVNDTEIIVVSEDMSHICDTNEVGELWCRGGTVALGYLGMMEKTKEKLVQSPFHPYPMKFWRTGDFGFRDENNILHYRGRHDHMVKVKGFRIEIGEVESALAHIDKIDQYCVVAVPNEKYGNRLYCFFSIIEEANITKEQIKIRLLERIPHYMIPFDFIYKKRMPKNSAGKVDRVLLKKEAIEKE